MLKVTATATGITIAGQNKTVSIRRTDTREIEAHMLGLTASETSKAVGIKKIIRNIMNANSKASYQQRFAKVAKILNTVGTTNTLGGILRRLENSQTEALAA